MRSTIMVSLFFDSGSSPVYILSSDEDTIDILLSLGPGGIACAWKHRACLLLEDGLGFRRTWSSSWRSACGGGSSTSG
jgi:hypothetical protein